ncbi:MAG: HD domain-containing phosphohydrolase [Planctomycetota bacterium]|mgnify:CR=1 FL=1
MMYSTKISASRERSILEIMLMIVVIGMTYLMLRMGGYKAVALNLFFLPIVLSGYYLGRAHAGVLALFTALLVAIATVMDSTGYAAYVSTLTIGLALTVWAGVLGLTALLVGTLCDERAAKADELHEAYIGVVEVMSKYLQSGNPRVKARSVRTAEIAQMVADEIGLPSQQVDDIRVGALLWELENVEVTTKFLTRAVDVLEGQPALHEKTSFLGVDLVHSLAEVLRGAIPLLLTQEDDPGAGGVAGGVASPRTEVPLGARIIRLVRLFDSKTSATASDSGLGALQAVADLRKTVSDEFDRRVLDALGRVVGRWERKAVREPVLV